MRLTIQDFDSEAAFAQLHPEWDDLFSNSERTSIFMTWEWQFNWWAAYHPGELWLIAIRDADAGGQLVALAPWFIDDHPKGRLVRSVGCVDVTDYLELLLRRSYEEAALRTLTAYACQHHYRYDALDLCNIPADSPLLWRWQPILEAEGYTVTITQQEVCPVIHLPDSWEAYLKTVLDKKKRGEVRRKLRYAASPTHEISWGYEPPTEENMERFFALMRASSPDKARFLENPAHVDFFKRVMPVMAKCGWLLMSFLRIDGHDVAAYISFDYNDRILLYNSGYDPTLYANLSPGLVLLAYLIRDAIERRRKVFDFLRGNEEYKYRMGGVDTAVMMLNARLS